MKEALPGKEKKEQKIRTNVCTCEERLSAISRRHLKSSHLHNIHTVISYIIILSNSNSNLPSLDDDD